MDRQPTSDLYLIYFLVIFGTPFAQNMSKLFCPLLADRLYTFSLLRSSQREASSGILAACSLLWSPGILHRHALAGYRDDQQVQERSIRSAYSYGTPAALGQISAEVAHRIKAPLTTIRVNAEVLEHRAGVTPQMKAELVQIEQEVDRCKEILQKLLELGRIERWICAVDYQSILASR